MQALRTPAVKTYRLPSYSSLVEYGELITFDLDSLDEDEVWYLDGFYYIVEWPLEDYPVVRTAHEEGMTV